MSQVRCPTCDTKFDYESSPARPFCSARCQQIDLGNWLDEKYSVPYVGDDDIDEEEAEFN